MRESPRTRQRGKLHGPGGWSRSQWTQERERRAQSVKTAARKVTGLGRREERDRGGKFCSAFQRTHDEAGVRQVVLPPRSPNLNAYVEWCMRSVNEGCLSWRILFGERSLRSGECLKTASRLP